MKEDLKEQIEVERSKLLNKGDFCAARAIELLTDETAALRARVKALEAEVQTWKDVINQDAPCAPGCDRTGHVEGCRHSDFAEDFRVVKLQLVEREKRIAELEAQLAGRP